MKRYLILLISIIWFLCSSEFHRSISSSPTRINPLLATDSASGEITGWIFNGLVKYDKNGKIVPDLAKSFYFENNKTLIFKLKENVLWHDGKKFNAYDVKFTYNLLNSKKIA
ncbi:MAG: peptide ABC transporter substrate-binding protein, partial [Epsilonproteobacteria bacterium]|nr:peptide ABC transporter substrate-binding protein [Campylobacterota bacterium]